MEEYSDFENICDFEILPHAQHVLMDVDDREDDLLDTHSNKTSDEFPHFICLGEPKVDHIQFHTNSYLKKHELQRVLNKEDPYRGNFNSILNQFFGFKFLTETCLSDSIEQLFYTLKMKYNKIKDHATELTLQVISKANEKEYLENRTQIVKFLAFLKSFVINDVTEETNENEILPLLNHIKSLILHVGRISQSPVFITLQTSSRHQICSPLYHLNHINLDIVWSVTAILYSLPHKFSTTHFMKLTDDTNMQSQSLITQYTTFLSLHQYINTSPFACSCVAEQWILLLNLLDKNQEKQKGKSFWSYMQLIFNGILFEKLDGKNVEVNCDVLEIEPQIECEDRLGFCWWLLLHLSSLYEVNTVGVKSSILVPKSNYTLLQTLISLSIQSEKVGEAQMRCYLNCCIKMCKNWEANTDLLLLLSNHFLRRLNSNFCLPYTLDGFQTLCDSGDGWLKQIKGRLSTVSNSDSSFHLFLNFFNEKMRIVSESHERTQFKMRIFSKFDAKLMHDLNETGLNNFVTVLLTIACETDLESSIGKMIEFIEIFPISSRISSQRMIIWCGMFALLEICEEKQIDQASFITKLTTEFITISQQLKHNRMDVMERQHLMKLTLLYIEGVESLVQKSKFLNLSEHILINLGVNNVLCNGNIEEIEKTLSMTEVVLTMANSLSKHILPFIKQYCTTQTPPTILADVAAGLTLMVYDMKCSIDLTSLFHHFGLNSNVQPLFCCRYLCHVLHHNTLIQNLHLQKDNVAYLLIGSWFRCTISLTEINDCLCELTRRVKPLIMKLPAMQTIPSIKDDEDGDKVFVKFLKALDAKFNTFENFAEKMTFKQNTEIIFKDILKHNGPVLKNFEPLDQLHRVYDVAAHIVEHCAIIIYVKSKADGILHSIIHQLLLPRIIYCHEKPLPPNLPIVLRDTLNLFVEGLCRLGPRRDICISNRLKDIVIYYILRFPLKIKLGTNGIHPLLVCLRRNQNSRSEFLPFALEVIQEQLKTKKSNHVLTFVNFIFELYTNTSIEKGLLERAFFVPLLSLLNQPDPNLKDKVWTLVSKMLPSIQNSDATKTSIQPLLSKFLQANMISAPQNVYKLMDVLTQINPDFVKELIPDLGKCIEKAEEKRGVGQDTNLRRSHQNLLEKLSYT
uniref:Protein MMS22-like n=1 Tax=Strigamia maritima TaxID=126957 RepID=T1J6X8_STRMM